MKPALKPEDREWKPGDRVFHPHMPSDTGTIERVVERDVKVRFDSGRNYWLETHWLRADDEGAK